MAKEKRRKRKVKSETRNTKRKKITQRPGRARRRRPTDYTLPGWGAAVLRPYGAIEAEA
jgi:hypothetical protein